VALQRERHIGRGHAASIVDDLDQIDPAGGQFDGNSGRPCIDRVFDQFLQRTGGSFDHFTGSDTVDEMLGEAAY